MKIILIFFLVSCTNIQKGMQKNKYITMQDLWKSNASKEKVIKTFGDNFQKTNDGIIYLDKNTNYPENGFYFDKSQTLDEQFIFLKKSEFEFFKKNIHCKWIIISDVDTTTHSYKTIESGECKKENIEYKYPSGLNAYEIRWKKK